MKFVKKASLRIRITLLAGAILIICSVILTISSSYNAHTQFANLTVTGPISLQGSTEASISIIAVEPIPIGDFSTNKITEAKKNFDTTNMIISSIVTVLGMAMVYFFSGRSLRPIQDLSLTISAITEDDLQKRIPDENRSDEVGVLGQSFNIMLDRLEKSFLRQKQFSASVAHELKTPLVISKGIQPIPHLKLQTHLE